MKNLRMKKFTMNDTTTSTTTARVVIMPNPSISVFMTASATRVANAAAPKNIANSTYQRYLPGRNTKARFMSQQNTFATVNPTAVAAEANAPRDAYQGSAPVNSAEGRQRRFLIYDV